MLKYWCLYPLSKGDILKSKKTISVTCSEWRLALGEPPANTAPLVLRSYPHQDLMIHLQHRSFRRPPTHIYTCTHNILAHGSPIGLLHVQGPHLQGPQKWRMHSTSCAEIQCTQASLMLMDVRASVPFYFLPGWLHDMGEKPSRPKGAWIQKPKIKELT